ncbi:MAG: PEP-CTERM sorting domain-containing protein [Phycisphaerae bacterium]|nr:PEP-CTERM sorting domain-containing protein [Phycisphaerae bacterium]
MKHNAYSSINSGTSMGTVVGLVNTGSGLTATLSSGLTANFQFTTSGELKVQYGGTGVSKITQSFTAQGERYYGVHEASFGSGGLDNRGLAISTASVEHTVADANATAPSYFTNRNYGVYVDTAGPASPSSGPADFSFASATGSQTNFSVNSSQMKYYVSLGAPKTVLRSQAQLAGGGSFLPPDWALDTIWWRNDATHEFDPGVTSARQQVLADVDRLRTNQIHAGAYWIDRPWSSSAVPGGGGMTGWGDLDADNNFEFHSGFGDQATLASDVNARGMQLMVWVANRTDDNGATNEFSTRGPAGGDARFDMSYNMSNADSQAWVEARLATLRAMGIKGFKIDRGDTYDQEMPADQRNLNNALFVQAAKQALGDDSFLLSRAVYNQARQHTAVWDGDSLATFDGLQDSMRNALRSANINMGVWGSDTGGYCSNPTKELWARWMQFSTYTPVMEVLIGQGERNPLNFDAELTGIVKDCTDTHHDLIPYVRSYLQQAGEDGVGVLRPMLLEFPTDENLADMWSQYMYGESLLVAPISVEGARGRSIYLPDGNWIDYNDRTTRYEGGRLITVDAPLGVIPVLVREGGIVVRGDVVQDNNNWTPGWAPHLEVDLFSPASAGSNQFEYWTGSESAMISFLKTDGHHLWMSLDDLGADGLLNLYLDPEMAGLMESGDLFVYCDGMLLTSEDYFYDPGADLLSLDFSGVTEFYVTAPEPATTAMLLTAAVAGLLSRRRKS